MLTDYLEAIISNFVSLIVKVRQATFLLIILKLYVHVFSVQVFNNICLLVLLLSLGEVEGGILEVYLFGFDQKQWTLPDIQLIGLNFHQTD